MLTEDRRTGQGGRTPKFSVDVEDRGRRTPKFSVDVEDRGRRTPKFSVDVEDRGEGSVLNSKVQC